MDQVTDVTRKGGVTTVKFLSGETLHIPSALYLERRVRKGDLIDPSAYRLFVSERSYPHALEAAMKFLSLRERSEQEVRVRLRRSRFDESAVQRVIDTLVLHDLLSDGRFAGQWAESRLRKYGKSRIARELQGKGVGKEDIKKALDALPEEEEYRRAAAQAQKLKRKFPHDPKKLIQALMRRGYSYSLAKKAAEEAAKDG